jgi:hypothetical protein
LIVAVPANPVGNVQPVYVSIANGTGSPMLESSGEIFARIGRKPRACVTTAGGRESGRRVRGTGLQRGNRGGLRRTVGRRGSGHCRGRIRTLGRKHCSAAA